MPFHKAVFKWGTQIWKERHLTEVNTSFVNVSENCNPSFTPQLLSLCISDIESVLSGVGRRRGQPLDISPRPGQREVKHFPREGQLPAQGHTAPRLQESSVPTFLSSHVGEVPTPGPKLTPGCLLLPTSQEKKKKKKVHACARTHTHTHTHTPGSIHHRLSNRPEGQGSAGR